MNKLVTFASEIRIGALLCCSATVLLTACGGGTDDGATSQAAQSTQLAGYTVSAETANAAPELIASTDSVQEAPTAAAAQPEQQGQAAASAEGQFAITGYDADLTAVAPPADGASTTQSAAAPVTSLALAPDTDAQWVAPATTYKLYVSPTGNDSNAGTAAAPFRTIARAARSTRASTTVFVAPGTYTGGFKTSIHGTSSGRITFISTTKYGARIVPPASSVGNIAWDNRGNYVDIVGFHLDGSPTYSGTKWLNGIYNGGSYGVIRNNWVHHIARNVACNGSGGAAIGVDSYYRGVKTDVIGNLVHDIGPTACLYVQGIYVSTSGSVKNNVAYRVSGAAIHLWHDANNVIITNNTVTTSNTGIVVGGGDFYYTSGPADYVHVYSNIVYDNKIGISEQGRTGTHNTYRNNLVYQNPTYNWRLNNGLLHYNTVTSAPYFVAYARTGTPNLRLTTSSPAIGRGTSTYALPYDFLERPRNTTTGFDIGAYQH